jgi:hypothetical protein
MQKITPTLLCAQELMGIINLHHQMMNIIEIKINTRILKVGNKINENNFGIFVIQKINI